MGGDDSKGADRTVGKGQARDDGKGVGSDDGWGVWLDGDGRTRSSHSASWLADTPYGRIRTGVNGGRVRVGDSGGANPVYYRQFYIAKGRGRGAMNAFLSEFGPPPSRGGKGFHKRQY